MGGVKKMRIWLLCHFPSCSVSIRKNRAETLEKIPATDICIIEKPYASLWIIFAFPAEVYMTGKLHFILMIAFPAEQQLPISVWVLRGTKEWVFKPKPLLNFHNRSKLDILSVFLIFCSIMCHHKNQGCGCISISCCIACSRRNDSFSECSSFFSPSYVS